MDTNALNGFTRSNSVLNFNYLMNLYEINYTLFTNLIDNIETPMNDLFMLENISIKYELISSSKYTNIFHCYFKYKNPLNINNHYAIKPHIIFTLYKDVRLLEAKSLNQSRFFETNINEKLKINLKAFYWLNNIFKKSHKNHIYRSPL